MGNTISSPYGAADNSELLDLTGQVVKTGAYAFASGGFADVWRGEWESKGKKTVAIKVIRSLYIDEKKLQTRLKREIHIWSGLQHDYIIPLYGVVKHLGPFDSLVSPYMKNGNASKFFEGQDIQSSMSARYKLLCDVASGLKYLHTFSPTINHGDLKASNILIDDNGSAMISDFGISTLIGNVSGSTRFTTTTFAGFVRWMAAELLQSDDEIPRLTTASDVWSYGCTTIEVMTGKIPYFYLRNDAQVIRTIMNGTCPAREANISEELWTLLQTCWREDPMNRPPISLVKDIMDGLLLESTRVDCNGRDESFDERSCRNVEVHPCSTEFLSTKEPSFDDFGVIVIVKNFSKRYINLSIFIGDQVIFEGSFVPPVAHTLQLKISTPYYFVLESEGQSKSCSRIFGHDQDLDLDVLFTFSG